MFLLFLSLGLFANTLGDINYLVPKKKLLLSLDLANKNNTFELYDRFLEVKRYDSETKTLYSSLKGTYGFKNRWNASVSLTYVFNEEVIDTDTTKSKGIKDPEFGIKKRIFKLKDFPVSIDLGADLVFSLLPKKRATASDEGSVADGTHSFHPFIDFSHKAEIISWFIQMKLNHYLEGESENATTGVETTTTSATDFSFLLKTYYHLVKRIDVILALEFLYTQEREETTSGNTVFYEGSDIFKYTGGLQWKIKKNKSLVKILFNYYTETDTEDGPLNEARENTSWEILASLNLLL